MSDKSKQWSEWINWEGGEQPVDDSANVQVQWRNYVTSEETPRAYYFSWTHNGSNTDIIAYRYRLDDNQMTPEEEEIPAQVWDGIAPEGVEVHDDMSIEEAREILSKDNVNHPEHYQSETGLECIDAIRAQMTADQFAAYCQGNIVKYLWRWRHKAGVESLKKAQWYLVKMISEIDREQGS